MTLPVSGAISFNNINVELGQSGTTQASLGQASYRALAGVPSGQISMSNFYGKANQFAFTISSNQTNLNLASYATSVGWNGSSAVVATIGSGVWIYSTSTGTPALTTGSFPGGLTIVNNGFIAGKGGNGWGYTDTGSNGGIAISLGTSVTINNTNGSAYIGGGGGGGGSKYYVDSGDIYVCGGGGGAGGGNGGTGGEARAGGAGSTTPNTAGANGTYYGNGTAHGRGGGAGGGGGAFDGPGGGGGLIFPGVGGAGGNSDYNAVGGNGGNANAGGGNGTTGGAGGGGGWGASGGVSGRPGGGPGSGGRAVALNGYSVTWVAGNTSRVYGAVS